MIDKTQATAHAEITAPISADLRGIEQEASELPEPSPTAGMNLGQRILHVGGRENAAGYIEFGSVAAVRALVSQVLRDRHAAQPARECLHLSAEAQAWLVHLPSSDTQNVYDSRDDAGYIDDLTNNDDAVVTPLYGALQAAPPAPAGVAVPAPAHDCCNSWFVSLSEGRQAALRDDKWMLAHAAFDAGRAALAVAPAQEHATQLAGGGHTPERQRMTAGRASFFMERFLKEEKLLGPNEQAALHFVIDMLAAPIQAQEDARDAELFRSLHWATTLMEHPAGEAYQTAMVAEAEKVADELDGKMENTTIHQCRRILKSGLDAARAAQGDAA